MVDEIRRRQAELAEVGQARQQQWQERVHERTRVELAEARSNAERILAVRSGQQRAAEDHRRAAAMAVDQTTYKRGQREQADRRGARAAEIMHAIYPESIVLSAHIETYREAVRVLRERRGEAQIAARLQAEATLEAEHAIARQQARLEISKTRLTSI